MTRQEIEAIKAKYHAGMRIKLVKMDDYQAPLPGTMGTITFVDDYGSIHVKWEAPSGLAVLPDVDEFEIV